MKKWTGNYILFGVIYWGVASGVAAPADIAVDLRGVVNRAGVWGLLQFRNGREEAVGLRDEAILVRADASLAPSDQEWVDLIRIIGGRPRTFMLPPGGSVERSQSITLLDSLRNRYIHWQWDGKVADGEAEISLRTRLPLLLGYVPISGGELSTPYVEPESGVSNLLAFVVHQHMKGGFPLENVSPNELSFLLLNGTTEPLDAAPPLSDESILHLTAPGIGYSTNITLGSSGFEPKTIPPGECGQWRIPFERILAQIPKETVEAIRAADGKLDLVWKTGDIESQPLPLILLPPTQDELDAAFLEKHADVPRIDENTDLTLEFRLAGIEQNKPVFLGWMRNNEAHRVLWGDNARVYSMITPSPVFAVSFYFARVGYNSRPNLIEAGDTIVLEYSVDQAAKEQRAQRPEIASAGFVMAERWYLFDKMLEPVWIALPGNEHQLNNIYAYDAVWHKVTSFEVHRKKIKRTLSGVPDLPPIAPLLADVYNPETPPEVTCVLWNRTEKPVQVADSRIIATNAALGYQRELVLPAGLHFPVSVAPGKHTDWRVPWSAIIEQIPPADLARIKAADGKLDLGWQANNLASPPLPLLLGWQGSTE